MTAIRTEKGRPGRSRTRRFLVALLVAAGLVVTVLVVLNLVVAARARRLQNSITVDQGATALEARRAAAGFERYLAGGARGEYSLDGPGLSRFIDGRYGSRVPRSVRAWRINLLDGRAVVEGVVDLQSYLQEMGMEQPASLRGLTGQDIPFSFRGRLETRQGLGRFTIEEVTLLGLTLPLEMVQRVAGTAGGRDSVLVQQFDLPAGIADAVMEENRLVIHGQGPQS